MATTFADRVRTMRSHAFRCAIALRTVALHTFRLHAAEADSFKSVLVLLLGQAGLSAATLFLGGSRTTLQIDVSAVHITSPPLEPRGRESKLAEYLSEKRRDRSFDVFVAGGVDRLRFLLLGNKSRLWPDAKAIVCLLGQPDTTLPFPQGVTGMIADLDCRGTVAAIRRLHPEARHIDLVGGHGAEDLRNLSSLLGPTRGQSGCGSCRLYGNIEQPKAVLLVQECLSQADVERYLQSDNFTLAAIELSDERPQVHFDELSSRRGFEGAESVPMRTGYFPQAG